MHFVQSCDSKECYKIEKELVGVKNIDVITRIHQYNDDTNEIKCITCGRISYANESKKLIAEKKRDIKIRGKYRTIMQYSTCSVLGLHID